MDSEVAYTQLEKEESPEKKTPKKQRYIEKFVHVVSILTIIILTHAVVYAQWLLPFYYVIVTPILIIIRIIMYWRNKWQYFLLDFCYYANIIWYSFIWLADDARMFAVVFAMANGPLIWAMVVYRNSLVFHHIDKVTSTYIHLLPALLSYSIQWYTKQTSRYWFKDFVLKPLPFELSIVIWLILIPQALFMLHSGIYCLVVNVIKKPSNEHLSSFNYLGTKTDSFLFKLFNLCGERCRSLMFYLFNWIFCLLTLLGVVLCYNFYIAHCILLVALSTAIIWNGGKYYMDVFGVRGFVDDP